MGKRKRNRTTNRNNSSIKNRNPKAKPHQTLVDDKVHVFVDDQNLFWNIVNNTDNLDFRIDFGKLLFLAARKSDGTSRGVFTAYIAGVIPDDDSFWETAKNKGFEVLRGYLGQGNRSKQDDAFLITEMVATLYEKTGPSTIVLVAGDADYGPPLKKAIEKGWRVEVVFAASSRGISAALEPYVHEFRAIKTIDFKH